MTSKYGLAKELLTNLSRRAEQCALTVSDAEEALLISVIQSMKSDRGDAYLRGILQYEIDSLGSGGVYEIQRGGGHS